MTRCGDLYRKWKQEHNFCGLGPSAAKAIDKYLEFSDDICSKYELNEADVHDYLPQTAAMPLLKFKEDNEYRNELLKSVVDRIKQGEKVTKRDVDYIIYSGSQQFPQKHTQALKRPHVKKIQKSGKKSLANVGIQGDSINSKIYALKTFVLTSGQNQIVRDVMIKYDKDNELAALALILIWAKEHMEST